MNWEQQRAILLATIKSKKGGIRGIIAKSAKEGETPSDEDEAEIEVLEAEIERLETNLERVEGILEDIAAATEEATEVAGETQEEAEASAEGEKNPRRTARNKHASVQPNHAKKGIGFAQLAKAKALAVLQQKNGNYISPLDIAKSQGMDPRVIQALEKAVVLNTTNSSELIVENQLANEFIELLRAETIVDKLAPLMRAAPFNAKIPGMASGSVAAWVGDGAPKPATNPTFNSVTIGHHKLAGIIVRTDDLLKLASPATDQMLRDDLIEACATLIDNTFIDTAAETDTRPAGILNGATKIDHTGVGVAQYKADLAALRKTFISNNLSLNGAQYVMSETRASDMAELRDALGNPYYRGMDAPAGSKTLNGLPVIESETAADVITLIKPSELYLADDGAVEVAFSDQATIDMGATTLVNLWQNNMTAIRAERHMTWSKRRVTAAAYINYTNVIV